jgi:peptidoglycan LD-endopeptidase LytH
MMSPTLPRFGLLLCLLVAGCRLFAPGPPEAPHDRYRAALDAAGLLATDAGRAWAGAADSAAARALPVALPHREVAVFDPAVPEAAAWRVPLRRGQALTVQVEAPYALFVDLFRTFENDTAAPERVASADSAGTITREAPIDEVVIVRLQPRLLEGGRYRLTLTAGAALAFPVAGHDAGDIRSFFGADRDGGARRHEGIDIFASRGTPVIATAPGVVTRVGTNALGGNVVWVRDLDRGLANYYAHLDHQTARTGQRVRRGDTLGTVGNTGNARSTPPHLHFGLYDAGALDPLPFVDTRTRRPPPVAADTSTLGTWARLAASVGRLGGGTAVRIVGAFAAQQRVAAPDGRLYEVPARALTAAPLGTARVDAATFLRSRPDDGAPVLDSLGPGASVEVLGTAGAWRRVRAGERTGFVAGDAPGGP